jgi:hypothetical protein
MNTTFRSLTFALVSALGTLAYAQPLPPYMVTVTVVAPGCNGMINANIQSLPGTLPEVNLDLPLSEGLGCQNAANLLMESYSGGFVVTAPCAGMVVTETIQYTISNNPLDSAHVIVWLDCGGGGEPLDCLGIPGGPNTVGTPCSNPGTGVAGYWNSVCECIPDTSSTACEAYFWVLQAYTVENTGDTTTAVPVPNEVWVWNLASGGQPPYTYLWSFGDGTTSAESFPTHFYASGGSYQLCLTIADMNGCTSAHCDTITVDEDGMYNGMIIDGRPGMLRNGFTLTVINELPTTVAERTAVEEVALWPNPVEDVIRLAFTSARSASLQLQVIDANGRVMATSNYAVNNGANQHDLNVSELESGMYLLQISDGTHSTSRRFVKH